MTVIRLRDRRLTTESPLTASRANRDGTRDIGGDLEALRLYGEDKLRDALRVLRGVYDIPAVVNILETKLAEERRRAGALALAAPAEAPQS